MTGPDWGFCKETHPSQVKGNFPVYMGHLELAAQGEAKRDSPGEGHSGFRSALFVVGQFQRLMPRRVSDRGHFLWSECPRRQSAFFWGGLEMGNSGDNRERGKSRPQKSSRANAARFCKKGQQSGATLQFWLFDSRLVSASCCRARPGQVKSYFSVYMKVTSAPFRDLNQEPLVRGQFILQSTCSSV